MTARNLPAATTPWRISIRWGNPYTKPPEGWPEVLGEAQVMQPVGKGAPRRHEYPEGLRRVLDEDERARPGRGYSICVGLDHAARHEQRKAWPPERKAAARVRELRKRIAKDAGPLFAQAVDEAVAREVAARPDYFDPARIAEGA